MGGISSGSVPTVFTVTDLQGNQRLIGWLQWEFRETYASGGISLSVSGNSPSLSGQKDFGQYFRYVQDIIVQPISKGLSVPTQMAINPLSIPGAVASGAPLLQAYVPATSGVWAPAEQTAVAMSGVQVKLVVLGY